MQFKLHFPELVEDCKPDMVAATAACEEVSKGKLVAHTISSSLDQEIQ
jgi:hypothetical protein